MDQLDLPLNEPPSLEWILQDQWRRNMEADAHNWTPEAMCVCWASGGKPDWDWWKSLPSYERNKWLARYAIQQAQRDRGIPMWKPADVLALEAELYQHDLAIAESWAAQIREAFKARKPCPIIPVASYRWMLDWAFELAQVPAGSLPENPELSEDSETAED